ncbi:MAG: YHS domain-containing (seleno)protein [Nitrososphaera sp.]
MRNLILFVVTLFAALSVQAQTFINTVGSDDGVAISSYDAVAFFTEKKAVLGNREFVHSHLGAKWLFSSAENLKAFQENPDKFLPAWGGQCAWCISENCVSSKKLNGDFGFVDGKLYLFAYGTNSRAGAKDAFLYGRLSRSMRVRDGEKFWVDLKQKLETGAITQPNSKTYKISKYE